MWWWGSPGRQISPAEEGKKPGFGKAGGVVWALGWQQGTEGECRLLASAWLQSAGILEEEA